MYIEIRDFSTQLTYPSSVTHLQGQRPGRSTKKGTGLESGLKTDSNLHNNEMCLNYVHKDIFDKA